MNKHTPGPWIWTPYDGEDFYKLIGQNGKEVIDDGSAGGEYHGFDVESPDLVLIAAAPDLLEALLLARQAIEERCESRGHGCVYSARETMPKVFEVIDGAIAKARGEA